MECISFCLLRPFLPVCRNPVQDEADSKRIGHEVVHSSYQVVKVFKNSLEMHP